MKIGVWCGVLLFVLDVSVILTPAECFTIPISVSTGMMVIIALVKIKAIIVKVLLGLKAMGVESFVWRTNRKRRHALPVMNNLSNYTINGTSFANIQDDDDDALMTAWKDLQRTVGKVITFDLESCTSAASAKYKSDVSLELPWNKLSPVIHEASNRNYSKWVSKVLGSSIGDPLACQILFEELSSKTNTPATSTVFSIINKYSIKPKS